MKTNCPWVISGLDHIYTGLNWLLFSSQWEINVRYTYIEMCGSWSLSFSISFYFYFFIFQMAASVLMQRCKLYYSSFVPIETQCQRLSEGLQQSVFVVFFFLTKFIYLCQRACCCSITKFCWILWDLVDYSMSVSSVLHYLPDFAQIHIHWWRHLIISSSIAPFSSFPQSYPASGSFPVSQFFT